MSQRVRRIFKTQRNTFGLQRQYLADTLPSHDPEDVISLRDLSNVPVANSPSAETVFHPYPNLSSFRLGEWYWNGGAQKSQTSFKDLVDIVGDPDFRADDVRAAR
jgi:hypothetical protein